MVDWDRTSRNLLTDVVALDRTVGHAATDLGYLNLYKSVPVTVDENYGESIDMLLEVEKRLTYLAKNVRYMIDELESNAAKENENA